MLWSQTNSSLLLAVQLRDCRDVRVDFEDRGVAFRYVRYVCVRVYERVYCTGSSRKS